MNRFFQRYVEFIRQPDVGRLLVVALLARMPVGMVGFAMLMFLRESLGNFALAGTAVGINFISMAAAAPVIGRIIDRSGPRTLLFVTGTVSPLGLLGVLACAKLGMPFAAVAACAAVAGAFASPITTLTRTTWRHRFTSEEDRRTAFALDSVMIEINFTLGPAIVATFLATLGATAGFAFTIAVVVAAFLIFLTSPALRYFKRGAPGSRSLLGPLRDPRLLLVLVGTFGLTLCFGFLEVGYPAYGTSIGLPALAGILLAVNSLGSACGGALYGGLHFKAPVERQFACVMALMALPVFLHTVASGPLAFGVVAFLAGGLIAPSVAAQSVLVSRLAPVQYATEAFTWSSTFIVSGLGAGMALGGFLVETTGLRSMFATGAAVVATMAALGLILTAPRHAKAARAQR
ncbi:MAG: MFS transporter [Usitatibacter sp.]